MLARLNNLGRNTKFVSYWGYVSNINTEVTKDDRKI